MNQVVAPDGLSGEESPNIEGQNSLRNQGRQSVTADGEYHRKHTVRRPVDKGEKAG